MYQNYYEYINGPIWKTFTDKYIKHNKHARCWICHRKYCLEGHHEFYGALGYERLGRDVFILCKFCHCDIHHIGPFQLPTWYWLLKLRRYLMRLGVLLRV